MRKLIQKLTVISMVVFAAMAFSGMTAFAEDQFLFNIMIKDSAAKYYVPVYEYNGTSIKVGPPEGKETVVTDDTSTTAKVRIRKKSDYYKANYQKISYSKTITLTSSQQIRFVVKNNSGMKSSFKITVRRPVEPSLTALTLSSTTTFMLRSGSLSVSLEGQIDQDVTGLIKVYNSKNKLIYKSSTVKGSSSPIVCYWDGCASSSNTAGLKKGEYVPSGTYKIKAYLKYVYGGKKKTVSKTVSILVEDPQAAEDGTTTTSTVPEFTKTWPWVVTVTGNRKVDYLAELICQQILKPTMSEFQRCKVIYKWCELHFTREGGNRWPENTKWKYDISSDEATEAIRLYRKKVLRMIKKGKAVVNTVDHSAPNGGGTSWMNKRLRGLGKQIGNCTDSAAMFECLCRHAGLECDIIETSYTGSLHHVWNVVKVDGKWYHCDSEVESLRLYGRTYARYTLFLRGKCLAKREKRYGKIVKKDKDLYKLISATDYKTY